MKINNARTSLRKCVKSVPFFRYSHRQIIKLLNKTIRKSQIATFHTGRCGSTVLGQMLNTHSRIYWASEIFEEYMQGETRTNGKKFVTDIIERSRQSKVSTFYGFETKYLPQQHLSNEKCINLQLNDYIGLLNELNFTKFIVIHRKNYLRRAISAQIGIESKRWHSTHNTANPTSISINTNSFTTGARQEPLLKLFECIDENYAHLVNILPCKDTLILTYEDDIMENPLIAYRKVCNFLNIIDESPKVELRRTNPFSYQEMVTNFGEVKSLLENTRYCWMLED